MSGHTPLPIRIAFGGAQGSLQTTTRALDTARLIFVVEPGASVPPAGAEVGFEVLVAGTTCRGAGRVAGDYQIEAFSSTERVVELAITALDPASADRIQRVVFRERLQAHGDAGQAGSRGQRVLGEPAPSGGGDKQRRVLQLEDETPAESEEPKTEPLLKSEKRDVGGGRVRPRPSRHHWEIEDRWRVR
jgi:hypothetical protein